MKKRFSFNRLLHNDKLMLVCALILGIIVWQSVVFGPSNEVTNTITQVPVNVTINNVYAQQSDLRIIGSTTFYANVQVSGQRAVVDQLSSTEFTLSADTTNITSPGVYQLAVKTARSSTNYDIVSVSPSVIEVTCDYWRSADFTVEPVLSGITVADSALQRLGTALVSGGMLTDGKVTVEGPLSQIEKIVAVKAVVEQQDTISSVTSYTAPLTAVDEQGQPVDMTHCRFVGAEENTVNVTVPVQNYKRIDFTYELVDVPAGYDASKLVTVTPSYIEVWGPAQDLEDFAERVTNLGVISMNNLTQHDLERVISFNAPESVLVVGGEKAVTLSIGMKNLGSETITVPLKKENVTFVNAPDGYVATVSTAQINVMFCGPAKTIKALKAADVQFIIDLSAVTAPGQYELPAKVSVKKYNTVWAYYGAAERGVSVGLTVSAE